MILGVDISGNALTIALCEIKNSKLNYIEDKTNRIVLDPDAQENYKSFHDVISSFVTEKNVTKIYLKKPADKGQQTAGANAFRIESMLNLLSVPVIPIHPTTLASFRKKGGKDITDLGKTKKYVETALWTALCGHQKDQ